MVWEADIYSQTLYKGGTTGMKRITGDTIYISKWTDFGYYDLCQYCYKKKSEGNPRIGRWIGVSHRVGSVLRYWIFTSKGKVISRKFYSVSQRMKPQPIISRGLLDTIISA